MLSVSCLAVFGATGAITAERGARPPSAPGAVAAEGHGEEALAKQSAAAKGVPPPRSEPAAGAETPTRAGAPAKVDAPTKVGEPARPAATAPAREAVKPTSVPQGTVPPRPPVVGPEANIAQRLDREAVGGNLKLRALGAAKTTQGDRAVVAIYVRMENVGSSPLKVDPAYFKLLDRSGAKYPISKVIEASLPAIELAGAAQPGTSGQNTEGNLTFEIPRTAAGLVLTYEPPEGAAMRIPLPPEFG